jgi:asparagine N-glycosylation enzyme membrane subunit Stt3
LFGYFTADGGTRWPYLRNIDSYYFYRHIGDVVDNGGAIPLHDGLANAPNGLELSHSPYDLYYYISSFSYGLYRLFDSNVGLQNFLAWFPVLLASLVVVPAYYIGKKLYDRKAGVLTSVFMVFMVPFMSRSLGGDPDSDGIAMLMMISTVAAFLIAYKGLDMTKILSRRNVFYSAIAGIFLALFALSWGNYWFALILITGFITFKIILDVIFTKLRKAEHVKRILRRDASLVASFAVMMVIFYLITVPYFGIGYLANPVTSIFGSFGGASLVKGEAGIFPNVYVSVAEMQAGGDAKAVAVNAAGLDTAASVSGLPLGLLTVISPFLLTLACITYLGYSYYKRREHLDTLLFMGVWFFGFLFASMIAVRATIFLAPVYAICSGIMLAKLWRVSTGEDRSLGA